MTSNMPTQLALGDMAASRVVGNLEQKVESVLERYPGARESYRALMFHVWVEFDGLDDVLGDKLEAFGKWFMNHKRATSPKTVQNRGMEVQRRRPELDAKKSTRAWRDKQARGGRVL